MIKTENLSMVFTTEEVQTKALNEVNIEVKQGEFVAIMGPSGCGITSTMQVSSSITTNPPEPIIAPAAVNES